MPTLRTHSVWEDVGLSQLCPLFWRGIDKLVGKAFCRVFDDLDILMMNLGRRDNMCVRDKLEYMYDELTKAHQDSVKECAPALFRDQNYPLWAEITRATFLVEEALKIESCKETLNMGLEMSLPGDHQLAFQYLRARHMVKNKEFLGAELEAQTVLALMQVHPDLGKNHPAILGVRRILLECAARNTEQMATEMRQLVDTIEDQVIRQEELYEFQLLELYYGLNTVAAPAGASIFTLQ